MSKPMKKAIPEFASEAEEQAFWSPADSTEYVDWSQAKAVTMAKLKPSMRTVSLRFPEHLLDEIRMLANK